VVEIIEIREVCGGFLIREGIYTTGIFGKWHLDGKNGASPSEQGFDVVSDSQKGSPNQRQDRPADPKGVFSITQAASDFIEKSAATQKPFFAFVLAVIFAKPSPMP
jgi:arylsulfatase A-like enzyme